MNDMVGVASKYIKIYYQFFLGGAGISISMRTGLFCGLQYSL